MTEIRVTTTAEIVDSRGRHIATVINTATARPGDNARYYATFTRGAIQSTEQQITLALIAQFGDKPDGGPTWPKAAGGAVVQVSDLLSDGDKLPPRANCPACKAGTCSLHAGGPRGETPRGTVAREIFDAIASDE